MAEYLRSLKIRVEMDTNKRTVVYEREADDTKQLQQAFEDIVDEVREDLSS